MFQEFELALLDKSQYDFPKPEPIKKIQEEVEPEPEHEPKQKPRKPQFRRRVSSRNKVFHHPQREAIEVELAAGVSSGILSKKYGIPGNILRYYRTNNLSKTFVAKVKAANAADNRLPEDIAKEIKFNDGIAGYLLRNERQQLVLLDAQEQALKSGNLNLIAPLSSALAKQQNIEAQIKGYVKDEAIKNEINIQNNVKGGREIDFNSLSVEELEALDGIATKLSTAEKKGLSYG